MTASAFELPLDTAPMEAKAADVLPDDVGLWQYEPKWDGFRCLVFKGDEAVDLRAKSGKPLGRYFPELVAMLQRLTAQDFVVDGEIVIEVDGKLSFEALQMRLHPAESRIRKLASATPARLVLYDVLVAPGGQCLLNEPLARRRAVLEKFIAGVNRTDLIISRATRDVTEANHWLSDAGPWLNRRHRRKVARRSLPTGQTRDGQGEAPPHCRLRGRWISLLER